MLVFTLDLFVSPSFKVATKTLPFYKEYFSVPYPLPKIDLIAIADFAAGECCPVRSARLETLLEMWRVTFDSVQVPWKTGAWLRTGKPEWRRPG